MGFLQFQKTITSIESFKSLFKKEFQFSLVAKEDKKEIKTILSKELEICVENKETKILSLILKRIQFDSSQ